MLNFYIISISDKELTIYVWWGNFSLTGSKRSITPCPRCWHKPPRMLCWVTPILQPLFPVGAWHYFGFYGNQRQTSHAYGRIQWFKWGLELFYSPIVIDKRSPVKLFLQKERNFLVNKMNHSPCPPTDEANWLFYCPFKVEYELLR